MGTNKIIKNLILLCLLFVTSCGYSERQDQLEEMNHNRSKWQEFGSSNYTMLVEDACFCEVYGSVELDVVDNEIVGVRDPETGGVKTYYGDGKGPEVTVEEARWRYSTINRLFQRIEGDLQERYHVYEVEYDPELGFPSQIRADWRRGVADDASTYTVYSVQLHDASE